MPFIAIVFTAIIMAPILEEIFFRYSIKLNKRFQFVAIVVLAGASYLSSKSIAATVFVVLMTGLLFLFRKKDRIFYNGIAVLSSAIFALYHASNFNGNNILNLLFGMIYIMGVGNILMIIRIRYGLIFSIVTHAFYNAIIIVPPHIFAPDYNYSDENVELHLHRSTISEQFYIDKNDDDFQALTFDRIMNRYISSEHNRFYYIPNGSVRYNGYVKGKQLSFNEIATILEYTIDSAEIEKPGYRVYYNPDEKLEKKCKYFTNEVYEKKIVKGMDMTPIKGNVEDFLWIIAESSKTPLEIDLPENIKSAEVEYIYYSNWNFEKNVSYLLSKNDLGIRLESKDIVSKEIYLN